MKRLGRRGVTLLELLVVVAVSGILMGVAGFSVQGLRDRYDVENQVRQMHSDLVNARVRAFEKNKAYFVIVTNSGYQITEDTNNSGGAMPDPGDRAFWSPPKQFKFPSQWDGTVIMDANGTISRSTGPFPAHDVLNIRFDTAGIESEYDCISVGPTRIREGIWDGMICAEKR